MNPNILIKQQHMYPLFHKSFHKASKPGKFLLTIVAMVLGIFSASAAITPYAWMRMTTLKSPGLDVSGNGHSITGGFTGNGESPGGTMPVQDNICVGGPLGPDGVFSSFSIRSRANRPYDNLSNGGTGGGNQGCLFEEPFPLVTGLATNTSGWGNFFQTQTNWVVESWSLPERFGAGNELQAAVWYTGMSRNGRSPGRQSGLILEVINALAVTNSTTDAKFYDGTVVYRMHAVCPSGALDTNGNTMDFYIGPPIIAKTSTNAEWMHNAAVLDNAAGTVSWYTNGVLVASVPSWRVYTTNLYSTTGFAGSQDINLTGTGGGLGFAPGGGAQPYEGYIAELRFSTFPQGQFSTTNLLTRRVAAGSSTVWYGPVVVKDPSNITVWTGGAAPFTLFAGTDTTLTYQWERFSGSWGAISGATNVNYVLENAQLADSGAQFRCVLTKPANSLTATSAVATATVVNNNPTILTGYSNAVISDASLKAYFPVDGTSSGTNLINVKNTSFNGNIFNTPYAFRNGGTNLAGMNQSLSLNVPNQRYSGGLFPNAPSLAITKDKFGYVEIPGDTPGLDFNTSSGNGTVEAVLHMELPGAINILSTELLCWLSCTTIGANGPAGADYAEFLADYNGYIYYRNGVTGNSAGVLIWAVPGGLLNKRTHVAITFQGGTNVTCYANGVSLGTKKQGGFGLGVPSALQPWTIGRRGGENTDTSGWSRNVWRGSIDELAFYGSTLTANTIASHSFILNNGTALTGPSVTKISPSKNLYTGFQIQTLNVSAAGTPPFGYQWLSNGVAIAGKTNTSLNVNTLALGAYNYTVVITNSVAPFAVTSAPVVLTVVAPSGYAAKVFASSGGGPRAFWPLDETSGTDILDWAGTHDGVIGGAYQLGGQGPVVGTGSVKMWGTNGAGINFSQIVVPFYGELNSYRPNLDPDGTFPLTAFDGRYSYEFWYRPDSSNTICAVSSQFTAFNGSRAGAAVYLGYLAPGQVTGENQTTFQYWTMRIGRFNNTNQGVGQGGSGGPTPPPVGQWCHICLVVDATSAGDRAFLFMNGVLENSNGTGYSTDPNAGFSFNANNLAPFVMGNRNRGSLPTLPMDGALSQVAVYDYPLTIQDITNHLSQIFAPAKFTQQPTPAVTTTAETFTGTITLTAKTAGIPNTYVWVKDGVELSQVFNLDGTQHYPIISTVAGDQQGPFSQKLVISQLHPSDSGNYWLRVYNPLNTNNVPAGQTNSAVATITITPDTIPPRVTGVSARGVVVSAPVLDDVGINPGFNSTSANLFLVEATFSERMDPASATNPANYTLSGGVAVTNVVLATSPFDTKFNGAYGAVGLVTSGLTPGASYTLTIANVYDGAQTSNKLTSVVVPFTAPTLSTGKAVWNYYYRVLGNFASLQSGTNTAFPYVPQFTGALTNFGSDAIAFGQSLNNNSVFSGQQDNYASTITAWVTPTNTGWFEFWLSADDNARLYVNQAGSDPAGATWLADSFGSIPFDDLHSILTHVQLTAGQAYFMQVVHTEVGGNDFAKVGWRFLGATDLPSGSDTNTIALNGGWAISDTNVPPIEGKFLSAYTVTPLVIAKQPSPTNIVVLVGGTANMDTLASGGGGGITYQWQLNTADQSGRTSPTNIIGPVVVGNYGVWRAKVTDGITTIFSTNVFVTAPNSPLMSQALSGPNLNVTFPTEVGINYVVETKFALTNGIWTSLTTNAGTGSPVTVPVTRTSTQQFFRVRLQ